MNIVQEFSRFAKQYDTYNIIQSDVAKKLVSIIDKRDYNSILDIGCGSGLIYKNIVNSSISFNKLTVVDFSMEMLDIHPSSKNIEKIYFDFNNKKNFKRLNRYDFVVSSSALQWSRDLDMTIKEISKLSTDFYFSFFTSNTFSTLHKVAGIKSPIYSQESIKKVLTKYCDCSFKTVEYRLSFDRVYDMFQYIKKSGVSGGDKILSYSQIKELIRSYPLDYLEFEVLFIRGVGKGYPLGVA
jgi:malonyl-CoA O-methyltransferase